ncbi:MAG: OmpA family protein [Acidobacteria bacterium]|jgi:chemotaxis protein MotB|nr:OmpA family protein [Acidobacteriota bacterium]
MAKWIIGLLVLLLVACGALGYWLFGNQQRDLEALQDQLVVARQDAAEYRRRAADLDVIRARLVQASAELTEEVEKKESELVRLHSAQDELLSELEQEIADKQVQVERVRDQLRVEMVDEVLFDSGESALKPAGIAILRKVGGVLEKTEGRSIQVQGHTDNVPIRGALAQRFPTNWELSAARATNVVRFLQDEARVDPSTLSAVARSEYRPRSPNETEAGRRQNRRIEILLGPEGSASPRLVDAPGADSPAL